MTTVEDVVNHEDDWLTRFNEIVANVDRDYLLALQWEEAKNDPLKTADVFGWRDEETEKKITSFALTEFEKKYLRSSYPDLYDADGVRRSCKEYDEYKVLFAEKAREEYGKILEKQATKKDFFIKFGQQKPEHVDNAKLNIAAISFWISQTHPGWDEAGSDFQAAKKQFKIQMAQLYDGAKDTTSLEDVMRDVQDALFILPDNHISFGVAYRPKRQDNRNHVGKNLAEEARGEELLTPEERKEFEAASDSEKEEFYDLMDDRFGALSDDEIKQRLKDKLKKHGITDENPFIEVATFRYTDQNGQEKTEKQAFLIGEKVVNGKKMGVIALPSCDIKDKAEFQRISNALFEAFEKNKDIWAGFVFDMRGNYGGNQHLYDRIVARIMGANIYEKGKTDVKLGAEVVGVEGKDNASQLVACGEGGQMQSQTYYKQGKKKNGEIETEEEFLERVRKTEADRVRAKGINKPVYVLTNGGTASSGETILSMLYGHPKFKQVGEYTAGCEEYGNTCGVKLPCEIKLRIGTVLRKLFQRNVEMNGFKPDIRVKDGQNAFEVACAQEKYTVRQQKKFAMYTNRNKRRKSLLQRGKGGTKTIKIFGKSGGRGC